MQYRIGNGGGNPNAGWLEFPTTQEYLSGVDASFETKTTQLPVSCNGQALVQIRWVYYYISGTGARAQVALDDVSVVTATLGNGSFTLVNNDFLMYPNPTKKGMVYFNKSQDIEVYDIVGKLILSKKDISSIDTSSFSSGVYFIKTARSNNKKLIVE
jgi:hypothetical protein